MVASGSVHTWMYGWVLISHYGTPSDRLLKDTDFPFGCTYLWTLYWAPCQWLICQESRESGDFGGFSFLRERNSFMSVCSSMPRGCPTADVICLKNVFTPISLSFFWAQLLFRRLQPRHSFSITVFRPWGFTQLGHVRVFNRLLDLRVMLYIL